MIIIPPSQSTDTAQAGSPTIAPTLFLPPVILPETVQSLTMKEDITYNPQFALVKQDHMCRQNRPVRRPNGYSHHLL